MFDLSPYQACIHSVHADTVQRVIAVESGGNRLALNVNGGRQPPKPTSTKEAIALAERYIRAGYSVDLGLMQVNSKNLSRYGVTVAQMFDACANIRTGSTILYDAYQQAWQQHPEPQLALLGALSAYNTGSLQRGFANGYVGRYTHKTAGAARVSASPPSPASDLPDFSQFYD